MTRILRSAAAGVAAGAAGTTALNAVTYLDMALRGRAASSTPEDTVEALARKAGTTVPGDVETRNNRLSGLAALTGIGAGVGVGGLLGVVRALGWRGGTVSRPAAATALAMLAGNGPMTVLGLTDPRTWSTSSWISDIVPHVAYGVVTAAVLDALDV